MAPFIAYEMENRGKDSWGATDGRETIKRVGPILDSFEWPENWERAIFHTRAATVGCVSERNAHPFVCIADGRKVVGIHNGHVSNYEVLKNKYHRSWAEVDSEHIFQHLAERRSMDDLYGSGTFAWFEDELPLIHLVRWNFGALECANMPDGTFVFASTHDAIAKAARFAKVDLTWWQSFNDSFEHIVTHDDESGKDIPRIAKEKLALGESYRATGGRSGTGNSGGNRIFYPNYPVNNGRVFGLTPRELERKCRHCREDGCESYICKKCVEVMRVVFEQEMLTNAV
jgi:Glutamine amidotransferase domain